MTVDVRYHILAPLGLFVFLGLGGGLAGQDIPLPGETPPTKEEDAEEGGGEKKETLKIRGYIEDTVRGEHIKKSRVLKEGGYHDNRARNTTTNTARAKLELTGELGNSLEYGLSAVGLAYQGETLYDLVRYLPESDQQQIHPYALDFLHYELEDRIYLQEAFLGLNGGPWHLRIGRQRFYTGSGYAFNPIDLFNRKDLLDPTYEVDGLDAVLLSRDLGESAVVQAMIHFSKSAPDNADYLLRLKGNLAGWDAALQLTQMTRTRTDYESINRDETLQNILLGLEKADEYELRYRWNMIAVEGTGEILGVGVFFEGGYVFIKPQGNYDSELDRKASGDHARGLIGFNYTFESQLFLMAEYLYLGQEDTPYYTLNDRLAYFTGEILSMNRDTLVAGGSYPLTDLVDFSLYVIAGLNDRSAIINPWLEYAVFPGCKMSLSLYFPQGREESMIGKTGSGGFFRIRVNY